MCGDHALSSIIMIANDTAGGRVLETITKKDLNQIKNHFKHDLYQVQIICLLYTSPSPRD